MAELRRSEVKWSPIGALMVRQLYCLRVALIEQVGLTVEEYKEFQPSGGIRQNVRRAMSASLT